MLEFPATSLDMKFAEQAELRLRSDSSSRAQQSKFIRALCRRCQSFLVFRLTPPRHRAKHEFVDDLLRSSSEHRLLGRHQILIRLDDFGIISCRLAFEESAYRGNLYLSFFNIHF